MRAAFALALVAGLLLASAQAAEPKGKNSDIIQTLKDEGFDKYLEILEAANAVKALGASANISTVFAATDEAIDAYLKAHNMTMDDLKKREALADQIIGYSIILGKPGAIDTLKPGQKMQVNTLAGDWAITIYKDMDGDVYFKDADGDLVQVPDSFKDGDSSTRVHEIEHLMLPGNVFSGPLSYTFDVVAPNGTVIKQKQLETFKYAVKKAGIKDMGNEDLTVFVPTDSAFKAAGVTKEAIDKMTPAQVKDLLQYHAVKGYLPFPNAMIGGKPVPTKFNGHTISLSEKVNKTANGGGISTVYVTDESGKKAEVIAPNFFSGKMTFHIIDHPLTPKAGAAAAAAAAPAEAKAGESAEAEPVEEIEVTEEDPAPKVGSRKLLQLRGGSDVAILFSQNNVQGAIQNAVDDASPGAAMGATRTGQANAGMVAYPVTQKFLYNGITTNFK